MTESLDARSRGSRPWRRSGSEGARRGRLRQGCEPDRMLPFFTQDAVSDGGERFGRYEGIDAIYGSSRRVARTHRRPLHGRAVDRGLGRPRDGNRSSYLWQPCTVVGPDGPQAVWLTGRLRDRYRREEDGWKFSEVHLDTQTSVRSRTDGSAGRSGPRRRWLGDRNSAGERAGGLASGSSSQCSRSKIPSRFEGVAARGRLLGRCRDEAPSRWS